MMKYILITLIALASVLQAEAGRKITYARNNQTVVLDLQWGKDNYGSIQWQQSADGGATWTDIAGATGSTYSFKMTGNALYRAHIEGDKACPAIDEERDIRLVKFTGSIVSVGATTAEMEITDADFAGAEIVEYGFCANFSSLQRDYTLMPRTKVGTKVPEGDFVIECTGLRPSQTYGIRPYFVTADGAVMYGPSRNATTIAGLEWSSEDWKITE